MVPANVVAVVVIAGDDEGEIPDKDEAAALVGDICWEWDGEDGFDRLGCLLLPEPISTRSRLFRSFFMGAKSWPPPPSLLGDCVRRIREA